MHSLDTATFPVDIIFSSIAKSHNICQSPIFHPAGNVFQILDQQIFALHRNGAKFWTLAGWLVG